jgi:hypothetical protein
MESFLWALNLFAVCLLCFWALKEDNRPSDSPDDADVELSPAEKAKAAAARRQKRQLFPRK